MALLLGIYILHYFMSSLNGSIEILGWGPTSPQSIYNNLLDPVQSDVWFHFFKVMTTKEMTLKLNTISFHFQKSILELAQEK